MDLLNRFEGCDGALCLIAGLSLCSRHVVLAKLQNERKDLNRPSCQLESANFSLLTTYVGKIPVTTWANLVIRLQFLSHRCQMIKLYSKLPIYTNHLVTEHFAFSRRFIRAGIKS
jgi:hypothetical protein